MRWRTKIAEDFSRWHTWWAWHPVKTAGGTWVLFEKVWRKGLTRTVRTSDVNGWGAYNKEIHEWEYSA